MEGADIRNVHLACMQAHHCRTATMTSLEIRKLEEEHTRIAHRAARYGDLPTLQSIPLTSLMVRISIKEAIRHNQDSAFIYLVNLCRAVWPNNIGYIRDEYFNMAINQGKINIVQYMLDEDHLYKRVRRPSEVSMQIAKSGFVYMMQWWVGKGIVIDKTVLEEAMRYLQVDMTKWIVQNYPDLLKDVHLGTLIVDDWDDIFKEEEKEMIKLLHIWKVDGSYRVVCKTGKCNACKGMEVLDGWWMDGKEYNNMQQWLPKEIDEGPDGDE